MGAFDSIKLWWEPKVSLGEIPKGVRVYVARPGNPLEEIVNIGGNEKHDPASLTKLMTLYVGLQSGNTMPEKIKIGPEAIRYKLNENDILKQGDLLTREEAFDAMITASDNVAATAIAASMGQGKNERERHRDFVTRMNTAAVSLGMTDRLGVATTRFSNASGWPFDKKRDPLSEPAQTNATDMALLINALYREFPKEAKAYLENPSVHYKKMDIPAHHGLNTQDAPSYLGLNDVSLGAKTGFTNKAMFNIASMATAKDGEQLIVVMLGVPPTLREKALTLVESGDIPGKPKSKKLPSNMVNGSDLRDAMTKGIIRLWSAIRGQDKIAFCLDEIPPAPTSFAASQAASSVMAGLVLPSPEQKVAFYSGSPLEPAAAFLTTPITPSVPKKPTLCTMK